MEKQIKIEFILDEPFKIKVRKTKTVLITGWFNPCAIQRLYAMLHELRGK